MSKYKIVLFDLDGTLSDPKIGITKSVQYALEKMGIIENDIDKLDCFIGPPLQESFMEYYGMNVAQAKEAVEFYRERFKRKGMFENEVFPDIPPLLKALKSRYTLVVATSKPTIFSEQILKYFHIGQYFKYVVGSNLDGTRTSKTEIIQYILNMFEEDRRSDFIMIGDRKYDMIGASQCGIDSIGVTYGYGSVEELRGCSPTYLVGHVKEIKDILIL